METETFSETTIESACSNGGEEQPAIPPLLRAEGCRCSVKPASRFALKSRSKESKAYAKGPLLNSQLGVGSPHKVTSSPTELAVMHNTTTWRTKERGPLTRRSIIESVDVDINHKVE
ncbi:unnamed protein product [Sphenostylis stenocarpa]|uniref:Uncharacterized protein n=1 Tax=Sphenostylis stenocarpa TaxID=92480 RepID=A0AA86SV66_9FABA|nr:unnamed protein product [Sphenostylis stenocarpa]